MATHTHKPEGLHGFRSIPGSILDQIKDLKGQSFRIGYRRTFSIDEINSGRLAHVGVSMVEGLVNYNESLIPDTRKRWGRWNANGRVVVRRDLPERYVSWTTTTPNFGDGARYGYSTNTHHRPAYRKEIQHEKGYRIAVTHKQKHDDSLVFSLEVDVVFPADTDTNSLDLLMAVSLVGESVGFPRVFPADQSVDEWNETQSISWELLPVGHDKQLPEFGEIAAEFKRRSGRDLPDTYEERYNAMRRLHPPKIHYGVSGFSRYVAFDFGKAVVLENYSYGNAAYVMFDDWQELSQRSRPNLLADPTANFVRVIHRKGWEKRIKAEVAAA